MCNNIFQEVKSQLNIRQVIEHYGIRIGRNNKFKCVFHNDKHPSASIKNDYFHCFVCGAGGDLITFTARYLNISNFEACKVLIKEFGLDIETEADYKAEREARLKYKNDIRNSNSMRDKIAKHFEYRSNCKNKKDFKLRQDRKDARAHEADKVDAEVRETGFILADMHRLMNEAINIYPYNDERHIWALQGLTELEFYIDLYDADNVSFTIHHKNVIDKYKKELSKYEGRAD